MTGSNEFKLNQPPEDGISSVKFSPNTSQFLLVSSWDTSVRLYDVPANSMRLKYQHTGAVLDCAFYDPTHAWSGGLDHQLKMHDLNTDQENLVGTHDAPIRCVEYCPEVNVMVTGSWDQTVKLWDPRTPCNAGTFSQPEKLLNLGRRARARIPLQSIVSASALRGLHPVSVWGQADCGHGGPPSAGVGLAEHGLCAAAEGVQPEVPDSLHPSLPEQAGLCVELHRRPSGCGILGPEP